MPLHQKGSGPLKWRQLGQLERGLAMPMVIDCRYRPGGAEARFAIRDVHLVYMMRRRSEVHFGGASTQGDLTIGMLLVLVTDDPIQASSFMAEEPYHCAGLFESVSYTRFEAFIPEPHTGFLDGLLRAARPVAERLRAAQAAGSLPTIGDPP